MYEIMVNCWCRRLRRFNFCILYYSRKAKKAFTLINENGFNDIEIVESDIDLDCIKFDGQQIKL